jgi:hypothetical protein
MGDAGGNARQSLIASVIAFCAFTLYRFHALPNGTFRRSS